MFDGKRGKMCIGRQIAASSGLQQQRAQYVYVLRSGVQNRNRRMIQPLIDNVESRFNRQGLGRNPDLGSQAQKGQDYDPRQTDDFVA